MKKLMFVSTLACALLASGSVFANDQPEMNLVAINQFIVADGVQVQLATKSNADGLVCQDYVQSAERNGNTVSVVTATVCVSSKQSLRIDAFRTDDGLTIQFAMVTPKEA